MQNFQQQYPRKVITGSSEDLQHNYMHLLKTIISTRICCKIEQISKNKMKSVKQASIAQLHINHHEG